MLYCATRTDERVGQAQPIYRMKKILNEPLTLVAVYLFIMIFTFGHAYNSYPSEEKTKWAGIEYVITNGPGIKSMGALVSSIFWPLYWSVELQEKK